jgi:hypothetical protein
MNRLAVALAADSAVTAGVGRKNKVYNTANKLFMLSNADPVGIMVYSSGSMLGVPWETLIKTFRDSLEGSLPRLEDYAARFLAFVEAQTELFTPALQRRYFLEMVEERYEAIAKTIKRKIDTREASAAQSVDRVKLRKNIVSEVIKRDYNQWVQMDVNASLPEEVGPRYASDCTGEISQLIAKHFSGWGVDGEEVSRLTQLAALLADRNYIAPSTYSGIVVAGFGVKDFFPVIKAYGVGDVYEGKIKLIERDPERISEDNPVYVGVYADSDMANLFLRGISHDVERFVVKGAYEVCAALGEKAVERTTGDEDALRRDLKDYAEALLEGFVDELEEYRQNRSEFEMALVHVPKDELASVAASLVNLNSFKKRISFALETVGGPVDVAVISKGDGFVWIDRKHYFKGDLNPHFFARREREIERGSG